MRKCTSCNGHGVEYGQASVWWGVVPVTCHACLGHGVSPSLSEAERERLFREATCCNEVVR